MDMKMAKGAGKKIKKYLILILIIASIFLAVICTFLIQDRKKQRNEIKDLSSKIEEMKHRQLEVDTVKEELRRISKYSAYEFNYTSIIFFSDKHSFMGIDVPLTGNSFTATVDGKMNIGINAEKIEFLAQEDAEGKVSKIFLTVPYSEILDNYTIQGSLEIYDEKNNIFNPVKVTDYNELIVQAEEKEKQKVLKGDLLQRSDEAVKYLLISHLQAVYGNDVEIQYEYLEQPSRQQTESNTNSLN